jgi:hypothetical protein
MKRHTVASPDPSKRSRAAQAMEKLALISTAWRREVVGQVVVISLCNKRPQIASASAICSNSHASRVELRGWYLAGAVLLGVSRARCGVCTCPRRLCAPTAARQLAENLSLRSPADQPEWPDGPNKEFLKNLQRPDNWKHPGARSIRNHYRVATQVTRSTPRSKSSPGTGRIPKTVGTSGLITNGSWCRQTRSCRTMRPTGRHTCS